jgi:hypothetical protein
MSGHDADALRRAGLLGEHEPLLRKPFSRDQLLAAVETVLPASPRR